jgi:dTDP-4-amino-4,6-dideoxygalactose transaminase
MILMNDFKAEPEDLRVAELAAVDRVLRSGWYVLGNEVKSFEAAWAERCGVPHAVGVGNGMDAIEIGLRALGIGEGDEVITTPMTAFATVLAIIRAGASPVLADINPDTALLDPVSVERCISSRTRAVLLVHLYGQVREMESWHALCGRHGIALLEDCAQSHLARWNGKVAGSFGRFGAYSFYPTKNLGALGDAGALVSVDTELAQRAGVLRNYGQSVRYHHTELGLNSRLDELQAALLRVRLERLDEFTARRREVAMAYRERITNPQVRLLAEPMQAANHVYHLFVVACEERDRLAQSLKSAGVETYVHYPVPVHFQPPGKGLRRDPRGLPSAEAHARVCLSMPCHPQLSDADVSTVIDAVNVFE